MNQSMKLKNLEYFIPTTFNSFPKRNWQDSHDPNYKGICKSCLNKEDCGSTSAVVLECPDYEIKYGSSH